MTFLLQIMNRLLTMGYSQIDIDCAFKDIINGDETIEDLMEQIGFEVHESQLKYIKPKLHRYESALYVTALKLGVL